ncbi:MAG: LPXTG cell wall anchor domain-containing protein, partial [Promicromonosporaceae bacterium]|nr:LPXTG cell wall anchor domain-containing protein [Promicromonosporaceae bacterium]
DEWRLATVGLEVVKTSTVGDPAFVVSPAGSNLELVEVTFTARNIGSETLTELTWDDMTMEGPDVVWNSCDGHPGLTVDAAITGLRLAAGERIVCRGTLTMGTALAHTNVLTITGEGGGISVEGEDDWTLTVVAGVCNKTYTPRYIRVGETTAHTWTIRNQGDENMPINAATDLTEALSHMDLVPGSIQAFLVTDGNRRNITTEARFNSPMLSWSGTIPADSRVEVTYELRASRPAANVVSFYVVTDTCVGTCAAPVVLINPELTVVKTSPAGDPATIDRPANGQLLPVVVTFTITNTGNVALNDLTWEDVTVEGPEVVWNTCDGHTGTVAAVIAGLMLEPGAAVTCRGTLVMGAATRHRNVLTVTGNPPGAGDAVEGAGGAIEGEDDWRLTVSPPVPEQPGLPNTGAAITLLMIIAGALLTVGLLVTRKANDRNKN